MSSPQASKNYWRATQILISEDLASEALILHLVGQHSTKDLNSLSREKLTSFSILQDLTQYKVE